MGKPVVPRTGHATARINGTVVAEATAWRETEGNVYFPPESVKKEYFRGTEQSTYCPWKGDASYYSIDVDGAKYENAAWYYKEPLEGAVDLRDHVAFYKNKVEITVE
ncbi:uncharacterized protein TRIVIDRAFT_110616 [Trichoderma virens Gv29-8]|uniref:DUF427 domain-containing protein n=1 Tax=Hypocrea virens (strain Gv29-8 / FGSC 10586) TaxID=413071 RepID=G9MT08_HYPVG|nr:uncharacterized protein TRIVIDRAFT_110616 [Trichoderma virens Gv29-8]EHK22264.1 hypothetical protein TRIVIDRAFT_110616 [Trichoderma virens Gv29-8]UKZ47299.1 hypothetical protein TrVGV298_001517 [Trichoderma virens]UKZ73872.1 hypothetical protein TrVFT333_001526 [Trichoderma virens FT-333]